MANPAEQDIYWLDHIVDQVLETHASDDEILVSSGASPSGSYHVGHLREILTADAVVWGLRRRGHQAKHVHVVDDFDVLRKVPVNVPTEFEQYLGMPLFIAPSPVEGFASYGDYFFDEFKQSASKLGIEMEIIHSHERYQGGDFAEVIFDVLEGKETIREIIESISGRQLKLDWSPIQILDQNQKLNDATYVSHDRSSHEVHYKSSDGSQGVARTDRGEVKLDWRVDWPARWAMMGVAAEPFGRDHASKGGSFDTGKELVQKVFHAPAPVPVPYEFINRAGDTKKMSASKGTGVTPTEALDVMPPALLRYFVLKSRPAATLFFDSGQGYGRLVDEFAALENQVIEQGKENMLYSLASNGATERVATDIPFNHIVTAYQSARGVKEETLNILKRSEHADQVERQAELIKNYLDFVQRWLAKWAPDEMKFELKDTLPVVELTDNQKQLLANFADAIEKNNQPSAQFYHETIHRLREEVGLQPTDAFQAIYRVLLGQDSGPKAGWFLYTIDKDWLTKRFREACN